MGRRGPQATLSVQPWKLNMMKSLTIGALAVAAVGAGLLAAEPASAYSQKVKKACDGDYYRLCSQYPPESTELRRCFESQRKALSRVCINALVDAGEVPKKYLRK